MKTSKHILFCNKKCWTTSDGKTLVPDGDPKAAYLRAVPGQSFPAGEIMNVHPNADDFFQEDEFVPKPPAPPDLSKVGGPSVTILKAGERKPVELASGSSISADDKPEGDKLDDLILKDGTQQPPEKTE